MNYIDVKKFPYKNPRNIQKQVLSIMDKNWDKYKYYICELPTGSGKSAIAKTVCSSVKKAFIITSTKQLQDQYINDFKDRSIVSIKGKANYKCNLNSRLNCESGYCVINNKQLQECKKQRICSYYNTRERALYSNIALTSYQYFLRSIECAGFWQPREVLVIDECHLLEQQIVQWAEIKISPKELIQKYNIIKNCDMQEFVQMSIPPTESGYKNNKQWLGVVSKLIFNRRNEKFEEIKKSLGITGNPDNLSLEQLDDIFITHKEYYELDKFYKKLSVFMKSNKSNDWVIDPWEDGLQLTPITISGLFNTYVERMGIEKIIFMSASILDLPGFRKTLGLDKDQTLLIRSDSEFDPEKSPIIHRPICKMNYAEINNNLEKIKNEIEKIMNQHPNEKGIIHTGNLTVSKYLQDNIESDRLLVRYGDVVNDMIVKEHIKSKEPTILVSSSLAEGVDLKGDLSRFQIIVKLPFLNLGDKRVAKKNEIDNDWYIVQMFKTLVQQAGRSTRNDDDHSVTYVLDKSFSWFINRYKYKKWLTPQFLKRIKMD